MFATCVAVLVSGRDIRAATSRSKIGDVLQFLFFFCRNVNQIWNTEFSVFAILRTYLPGWGTKCSMPGVWRVRNVKHENGNIFVSVGYFCDLLHLGIVIFALISYPDGDARARRECAFNRIWHLPLSCNRSDSFYSRFVDAHGAVKHARHARGEAGVSLSLPLACFTRSLARSFFSALARFTPSPSPSDACHAG